MHGEINRLILVQDKDVEINDLLALQKKLPVNLSSLKDQLEKAGKELEMAKEKLKAYQVDRKKFELEVDASVEKRQKLETQLMTVKTNQEYKAFEKEIYGIKVNTQKLENEVLRLMEEVEAQEAVVKEKEGIYKEEQEKFRIKEQEIQEQIKKSQEDVKQVRSDREHLAKDINSVLLKRYEKIMGRMKGKVIVPIVDRNCKGCHTLLPPQVVVNVRRSHDLTICENCGRILIYDENASE